jgi:succinoglycan biosynthesis transport protein ExoP
MENHSEEQSTAELFAEYASLLLRWSWLLILLAVLAGGSAYYFSNRQVPVYQASTLIMINGAPGVQSDAYSSIYLTQQLTTTFAQTMTTRPMLDAVARKIGLESLLPNTIQVKPVENTSLMRIVVEGNDPAQVALIANTMFSVFADQLQADQSTRYADSKSSLESQMATSQQQIKDSTDALTVINQKIQDAQNSLDLLDQQIADITRVSGLEAVTEEMRTQKALFQSTLLQYQPQQTQLQTALSQYQSFNFSLMQSYQQVKLAEAESSSLVIQKDPAVPPEIPIQPKPYRSGLLAAVVGLLLGAGIVFLIEFLDDSMRDPQEITTKWGIPILGMIINFNSSNGNDLITEKQPRAPVSEAFRSLRTNLQFASIASPIRTLLVTSPSPQDGKTTIVGNLACVLAQGGMKVVILDADLRRPRVHKEFHLQNRLGLTDQFIHPQEFLDGSVQPTEVKNLFALTSGSLPPNPSELLGSQRMGEIVQALKAQFDLVVIDSPPSLVVTDANVLANRADGVLLVIRPSLTKRAAIKHTIEQLIQVKANIVGVVINGVDVNKSRYNYYRGYYHKYGRGYATYWETDSKGKKIKKSHQVVDQESKLAVEEKGHSDKEGKTT